MVWNSLYDSDDYDPDGDLIGTIISIIIFTIDNFLTKILNT